MSNAFKVFQVSTTEHTQIVVRDARGRKLFDIEVSGISIAITTPSNAEIKILPNAVKDSGDCR